MISALCQLVAQCVSFEFRSEWLLKVTEVTRAHVMY